MSVHRLKIRVARSLRVTVRPTAIFGSRGINTPSPPSVHSLLPFLRAELLLKPKESSLTPLSSFFSDSFEGFEREEARAKIRASEPHSHLLSTWFWSSPRIQVCYSWSLVLLDG